LNKLSGSVVFNAAIADSSKKAGAKTSKPVKLDLRFKE